MGLLWVCYARGIKISKVEKYAAEQCFRRQFSGGELSGGNVPECNYLGQFSEKQFYRRGNFPRTVVKNNNLIMKM